MQPMRCSPASVQFRKVRRPDALRRTLDEQGWNVGSSTSPIIPLIVGEARRTIKLAAELRRRGLLVPPIRPPTVPDGASRLRLSLCYGHTAEMIDALTTATAELCGTPG